MVNTNSLCYQRLEFLSDAVLEVVPRLNCLMIVDGGETFIQEIPSTRSASPQESQMRPVFSL